MGGKCNQKENDYRTSGNNTAFAIKYTGEIEQELVLALIDVDTCITDTSMLIINHYSIGNITCDGFMVSSVEMIRWVRITRLY